MAEIDFGGDLVVLDGLREDGLNEVMGRLLAAPDLDVSGLAGMPDGKVNVLRSLGHTIMTPDDPEWRREIGELFKEMGAFEESVLALGSLGDYAFKKIRVGVSNPLYIPPRIREIQNRVIQQSYGGRAKRIFLDRDHLKGLGDPEARQKIPTDLKDLAVVVTFDEPL